MSQKRKIERLGKCGICHQNDAKYNCPGCEVKTCSLTCVREHKKQTDCEGTRPKTFFLPLKDLSEDILKSDCHLFEQINNFVKGSKKQLTKSNSRITDPLPHHLELLRKAVRRRGAHLMFCPRDFKKHKENTTYFDWKNQVINWKLKCAFLNTNHLEICEKSASENSTLNELIQNIFDNTSVQIKNQLKPYIVAGIEQIDVLMKAEKIPNSSKKFYILDINMDLKSNLSGKSIIEYPELFLLIRDFYISKEAEYSLPVKKEKTEMNLLLSSSSLESGNKNLKEEAEISSGLSSSDDEMDEGKCLSNYKDLVKS